MTHALQPHVGAPVRRLVKSCRASLGQSGLVRLLLVLMLWLGGVVPVAAHASLVASQPADGAIVVSSPANLLLTFNEPVSPRVLRLVTPEGHTVPLPIGGAAGATLTVTLPLLGIGTHLLSWRVISADGHPIGGSLVFSIGRPSSVPGLSQQTSWPVRAGIAAARLAIYLGLFIGIGGVFFAVWISPVGSAARKLIRAALYLGVAAIGPAFVFQGLDILGAPLSGAVQADTWQTSLQSTYALTLAVIAIALLLALTALAGSRSGLLPRPLAMAAVAGAGLALALSGHASTAPPQWLTRPAVFLHVVCIAVWVGSLVPLCCLLRSPDDDRSALLRFSAFIPVPFLLLLASGIVLAVIQTGWFVDLWHFAYGRILAAKLVLVAALIAIAAVNRLVLTPRIIAGKAGAGRRLAGTVLAEIVLVAGILGLVTLWRFTPPPRALAAAEPAFVHLHDGSTMADLTLTPGRAGAVLAEIRLKREDLTPLPAREVRLTLSNKAAGIEPIVRPGRQDDATWRIEGLVVPIPGRWEAEITVLVSDFDQIVLDGPVVLQP